MKIFLIGLPGSGKTTMGKSLADALRLPFADLDVEIEKSEGLTVPQIFEKRGEDYFRAAESELLKKFTSSSGHFVMAAGGGAPCFNRNMTAMNQSGITVFLDVPARAIASRLTKTNLKERPLLAGLNSEQLELKINGLRSQRIDFYGQARFTFSGEGINTAEVLAKIKG